MFDTVFINGLVVETFIGCYDYEKEKTQSLRFDFEMAWDVKKAGDSDLLVDTLDYHAVVKRVERFCQENHFELVEALGEQLLATLMHEFSIPGVRLRLAKPEAIGNTVDVGIRISRGVEF